MSFAAVNALYFDQNQKRPEFVEQTAYGLDPLRRKLTSDEFKENFPPNLLSHLGHSFGRLLCRDDYAQQQE